MAGLGSFGRMVGDRWEWTSDRRDRIAAQLLELRRARCIPSFDVSGKDKFEFYLHDGAVVKLTLKQAEALIAGGVGETKRERMLFAAIRSC